MAQFDCYLAKSFSGRPDITGRHDGGGRVPARI